MKVYECPGCRSVMLRHPETYAPLIVDPPAGSSCVCVYCSEIWVWDICAWRRPGWQERERLLQMDEVIRALAVSQDIAVRLEHGRATMQTIIADAVIKAVSGQLSADEAINAAVAGLQDRKFHTHEPPPALDASDTEEPS